LPSQAGLRILQTARLSQAAVHKPHSESRASLEVSYFAMAWMSGRGIAGGGNKVLLTMFARQLFPTWLAKERFH
jgi:hypothetical protein